jgi:hypothetical protein
MKHTRFALVCILALLAVAVPALAQDYQEKVLSYDGGEATGYKQLYTEAARVDFQPVKDWKATYLTGVEIYARRYGSGADPKKSYTNVAVTDSEGKVLTQKLVPYASYPTEAGWVYVDLPTIKVSEVYSVVVYPYARPEFGVEIGCTEKTKVFRSFQGNPSAGFKLVEDKTDWMIRADVRSLLEPLRYIDASEISGVNYLHHDDGTADGYFTFQRGGALVGFKNMGFKTLEDVFIYGKVEGDWFATKPTFRVFLLDHDLRVISSVQRDYTVLTEIPHWTNVDFPDTKLPGDFYILVEPVSRPEYKLNIGFDTSGGNNPNYYGTVGAFWDWPLSVLREKTNWMIRAKVI